MSRAEAMQAQFTLTRDDVDAFNAHVIESSFWGQALVGAFRLGVPVLIVALSAVSHPGGRLLAILDAVIAVAAYSVVLYGVLPLLRRWANRRLVRELPGPLPAVCRFEADGAGVRAEAPGFHRAFPWAAVRRIDEAEGYFFLFVAPQGAVIIPRRGFATEAAWDGFLELVRTTGA